MNALGRLGLYAAGLAAVFAASAAVAGAIVPDDAARFVPSHDDRAGEHHPAGPVQPVGGLGVAQDGYLLEEVRAPGAVGEEGDLSLRIVDRHGEVLRDYAVEHGKELHLIVVRSDGAHFRHVHPERGADGVWSLPWTWDAAGAYRVYADFVPGGTGETPGVTLTRTVHVAGAYAPASTTPSTTTSVDGFDVTLHGELRAGEASELTVEVTRDGEPVTRLEPYLGAFGHLVALREGDLAYLHVHPEGAEPGAGDRSGPNVTFVTEAPTDGRYLLYLDFQVDGQVRTARFTVDTVGSADGQRDTGAVPEHDTTTDHDHGEAGR